MFQPQFYIYSKFGCGYCSHLIMFLERRGLPYVKLNLDNDYSQEEFVNMFGRGASFPQVSYKGQQLGGMKDTVRYISENNLV